MHNAYCKKCKGDFYYGCKKLTFDQQFHTSEGRNLSSRVLFMFNTSTFFVVIIDITRFVIQPPLFYGKLLLAIVCEALEKKAFFPMEENESDFY